MNGKPLFRKIHITRKLDGPYGDRVVAIVQQIEDFVHHHEDGLTIVDDCHTDESTLFIAVGGDGTVARAARKASHVRGMVMGIHCGNLGFLSEFNEKNVGKLLTRMYANQRNKFICERRDVLICKTHPCEDKHTAVNEFYLTSADRTIISYNLIVNGETIATQRSDGVMVCSPTGSTAYGLSAGGGIILPSCNVMQIVAVAPHALTNRPIIVPTSADVSIVVPAKQEVLLYVDGQVKTLPAGSDGTHTLRVNVEQDRYFNFVKSVSQEHNFFNILQQKLR